MKYEELKLDLARLLSLPALEHDPFVMAQADRAIGLAHNDVALALRTPARTIQVTPSSTGVATWPTEAFAGRDGVQYAYVKTNNRTRNLLVLTEIEAYNRFPNWESLQGESKFIIIDPSNSSAGIRFVPYASATGTTYHIRYVKIPSVLDSPNDIPLDGELPQYHPLISLRAAILMLEYDYAGGETADYIGFTNIRKYEALQRQYQARLIEAQRAVLPQTVLVRNPFWSIE